MFINSSHDDFVSANTRAVKVCREGFAFTAAGLAKCPVESDGSAILDCEAMTLGRLCALKLFMPPWFGLEPLNTPRYRTPRLPGNSRQIDQARRGPRRALPVPPPSVEERSLACHLLCGRCHPDQWIQSQPEEMRPKCLEMLALPVTTGKKLLLGRVFDCACFAMAGADSPVVTFLAHAANGERVTARDAWLAIIKNMPWCACSDVLLSRH